MTSHDAFPQIIELNVGGCVYSTAWSTLTRERDSLLAVMFTGRADGGVPKDSRGYYFIDRDGPLFRYVLDYLRCPKRLALPDHFSERARLRAEAEYFRLPDLARCVAGVGPAVGPPVGVVRSSKPACLPPLENNNTAAGGAPGEAPVEVRGEAPSSLPDAPPPRPSCITLGYRGTFAFGRDGLADVKFRKLSRLLISGRVSVCRAVFGETLNESRDPDRGTDDRYTCRFFLKHTSIEQAFDRLLGHGYRLHGSCGTGTNTAGELKPGSDSEESRWNHYNEFIFFRLP